MEALKRIFSARPLLLLIFALIVCNIFALIFCAGQRTFTFTYDLMGGTYNNEYAYQIELKKNETAADITPAKAGYIFAGWTKDIDQSDKPSYSFDEPICEDTVIYAVWRSPELNLHTDGGFFSSADNTDEADYSYYLNHKDFILPIPQKEGFVFGGWYDSDSHGGEKITYIPKGCTDDFSLYAKWIPAGVTRQIIYLEHCVINEDGTATALPEKEDVYNAFFTAFYYYIVDVKGAEEELRSNAARYGCTIESAEDFLAVGRDYNAGSGSMTALGSITSGWFLKSRIGGSLERQSADCFVGYCYQNNQYVDLLRHLIKFFAYWRQDEGYTTPTNNGSDFFAESWAPVVDICKFFYFDENTSYVKSSRVLKCFENIPGVFYPERLDLVKEYAVGNTTELTQPAFEGYTFVGWYRELEEEPIEYISPAETEDVYLIGVWEKN